MIKIDVILNVIGIAFIILSITIIISSSKKEQRMFEEISSMYDEVKYYYNTLGKAMISFDDLIEKSIDKIEKKQNVTTINNDEKHQDEKNEISFIPKTIYTPYKTAELKENKHLVYEKILKLKKMGLSNIEIAQKLEIGIREVEIILRMMEKV